MLTHLKKFFSATAEQPVALAASLEEDKSMSAQEGQSAGDINTAELSAQLASATEALSGYEQKFAELTTKFAEAQASLASIEAEKASLVAKAAEAKLAARKEKVELAIGTAKAADILAATEALGDEQFNAIVAAFSANLEAEAKSPMFSEVGVAAEAAPIAVDPVAKLAANLAAQFNTKGNK